MQKTIKIAVTGGIGSGKSSLSSIFKDEGFPVFSCDEIYQSVRTSPEYLTALQNEFEGVVVEGKLNKEKLSSIVFSSPSALEKLNALSHPIIMSNLLKKMNEVDTPVVFAEVPLLFEGNFQDLFDYVIVVLRDKRTRIESVKIRSGLSEEEVLARINSQFPHDTLQEDGKIFLVYNDENLDALHKEGLRLLKRLSIERS